MQPRNFDERVRPKLGADAVLGRGAALRYDLTAVVAALVDYRVEQQRAAAEAGGGDPMMSGGGGGPGDSPALERYRLARAIAEERRNDEAAGLLVRRDLVVDGLRQGITAARASGEKLVRFFGNEAGLLYNEGIDEFERAALRAVAGREDAAGGRDERDDDIDG